MKTRRVYRYYCDYCGKAGCGKWQMERHEKHCTMNPGRVCRMCKVMNENQPDIKTLIDILPKINDYKIIDGYYSLETYPGFADALAKVMVDFRDAANGCPACMLSAIRQAGIHPSMVDGFDYKKESLSIFQEINDRVERDQARYY